MLSRWSLISLWYELSDIVACENRELGLMVVPSSTISFRQLDFRVCRLKEKKPFQKWAYVDSALELIPLPPPPCFPWASVGSSMRKAPQNTAVVGILPSQDTFSSCLTPSGDSRRNHMEEWDADALPKHFLYHCRHSFSRYIKYNVPTHFTLQVRVRYVHFHSLHSLSVLSQRVRTHVAVQSWASFMSLAGTLLGIFLCWSFFNLNLQNQKLFPGCADDCLTLGKVSNTLKYLA